MGCPITLKGITLDCEYSLGGIKEVWITEYSNVKTVTVDPESNMISAITLETSAKWYDYQFRKGTGSLTSTLTVDETAGVNYVANELSLVFTKMETAKRLEITAMSIGRLAVIVLDSNGKYWFLGYDFPISASAATGQTGTAFADFGGYNVTLTDNSKEFPYEVPASIIETLTITPAPAA